MRSFSKNSALVAAAMMMAASSSAAQAVDPEPQRLRDAGEGPGRRSTPPRVDTELAREIAAWNAAVDARKKERKAMKAARRSR